MNFGEFNMSEKYWRWGLNSPKFTSRIHQNLTNTEISSVMTDPVSPAYWDPCWQKLCMKNLSYTINALIVSSFDCYIYSCGPEYGETEDFMKNLPWPLLTHTWISPMTFHGKSYRNLIIWSGGLWTFQKFRGKYLNFIWIVSKFPHITYTFSYCSILGCFWDVSVIDFQAFGGKLPETILQKSDLRKHANTLLNPEWSTGPTSQHRVSVLLKWGSD